MLSYICSEGDWQAITMVTIVMVTCLSEHSLLFVCCSDGSCERSVIVTTQYWRTVCGWHFPCYSSFHRKLQSTDHFSRI